MPKGVSMRPSTSFPDKYMKVFQSVLQTGKPIEIRLGDRGAAVAMRQSMNQWRNALNREGSPIVGQLYGITVSVLVKHEGYVEPMTMKRSDDMKLPKNKGHWYLLVRSRDAAFAEALRDVAINVPDVGRGGQSSAEAGSPPERGPQLYAQIHPAPRPATTVDAINNIFDREEGDEG